MIKFTDSRDQIPEEGDTIIYFHSHYFENDGTGDIKISKFYRRKSQEFKRVVVKCFNHEHSHPTFFYWVKVEINGDSNDQK